MLLNVFKSLVHKGETDTYLVMEGSFNYEFPAYMLADFKSYIFKYDLVSRWYKNLDEKEMLKVKRTIAYE